MLYKKAAAACLAFVMVLLCLFPTAAFAATESRTVRVGFPIQPGLSEVNENGDLIGYNYDYLQEIAQYTGWNYEFVQLDGDLNDVLVQMLEMLENGELDLLGSMAYSDESAKVYDFAGQSYGTVYTALSVLYENTKITQDNYQDLKQLRIAALDGAKKRIGELDDFCSANHISYTLIPCKTEEEQLAALESGKADALLSVDVNYIEGTRAIAKFSPNPFYFATTKGNKEIVQKINSAILSINQVDPLFSATLSETYFNTQSKQLILSDSEKKYIENTQPLKVGVLTNNAPFQYADSKTGELKGIAPDLFDYISEQTGLKFQFVHVSNTEELEKMANEHSLDLVATLESDYKLARKMNVSLTKNYTSAQYIMMLNKNVNESSLAGKRLAMRSDYDYDGTYMGNVVRFESSEECIDAVNSGKADYTYGNSYTVQYYMNNPKYSNVKLIPQSYQPFETCIGVVRPGSMSLLNILNKTLLAIPEEDMQAIIYKNTSYRQEFTLMNFIEAYPSQSLLVIISLAVVIILVLLLILHARTKLNKKIEMDIKKHYLLYELSNEHFFEYDFLKNELMLSLQTGDPGAKNRNSVIIHDYQGGNSPDNRLSPDQKEEFLKIIKSKEDGIEDMRFLLSDGTNKWTRVTFRQILDGNGKAVFAIGKLTDIDEEKREKSTLIELAKKDGLTGVYNISAFKELATEKLKKLDENCMGALLVMDVDNFKEINDKFGHYIGDKVLKKTAKILSAEFGGEDIVGRLGGDEFIVYISGRSSKKELESLCGTLCGKIHEIAVPSCTREITISVGAAAACPGIRYYDLYKKADRALYDAKKGGRDRFSIAE